MIRQWIAVNNYVAIGPFPTEAAAADYIATRPPQAGYRVLELDRPPTKGKK